MKSNEPRIQVQMQKDYIKLEHNMSTCSDTAKGIDCLLCVINDCPFSKDVIDWSDLPRVTKYITPQNILELIKAASDYSSSQVLAEYAWQTRFLEDVFRQIRKSVVHENLSVNFKDPAIFPRIR